MATTEIRERRRTLRYRHLVVRQMVQMKNRVSGLLMETGVSNKQRLHRVGYFPELLANADAVSSSIRPLLHLSREDYTTAKDRRSRHPHAARRSNTGGKRAATSDDSCRWQVHSSELGMRDGGHFPFPTDPTGH